MSGGLPRTRLFWAAEGSATRACRRLSGADRLPPRCILLGAQPHRRSGSACKLRASSSVVTWTPESPTETLARVSSKTNVVPIQAPVVLDSDGILPNTASLSKVQHKWRLLLDKAAADCVALLGDQLVSLYVRGSVPQGAAIDGLSDLDMIVYFWLPSHCEDSPSSSSVGSSQTLGADQVRTQLRQAAEKLGERFPFCVKVEYKAFGFEASGAWAAALDGCGRPQQGSGRQQLPVLPAAFEIATSAALVLGKDLATLLPPDAGIPRPVVLPSLAEDVVAAMEAGRRGAADRNPAAVTRAARWALKRVLRGAFEAVDGIGWYTRDLYWCCHAACRAMPEMEQRLVEALTTYVSLSDSGLGQEEEVLQRALSALDSAAALALDVLKSYWTPVLENGTGHVARELSRLPIRAWAAAMNRVAQKPRESGAILGNRFRQAWFAGKARVVDLDSQIRQAEMEFVRLATCPWGEPVAELDCTRGVPAQLLGKGGLPDEPLLLRGAASSWPAVQLWSLRYLVSLEQQFSGKVRVAPGLEFPFCEPALLDVLVPLVGAAFAPSTLVTMTSAEFANRLAGGVEPLVYQTGEKYYMQADLDAQLLGEVDLDSGVFRHLAEQSSNGRHFKWAQQPRVWISAAGSVSPTHFDNSPSLLSQVKGIKQMLFWRPDDLPLLEPYPDNHLMRRRCRSAENETAALHATLHPGDAIFFPSRWAHYTETISLSFSVTARLPKLR